MFFFFFYRKLNKCSSHLHAVLDLSGVVSDDEGWLHDGRKLDVAVSLVLPLELVQQRLVGGLREAVMEKTESIWAFKSNEQTESPNFFHVDNYFWSRTMRVGICCLWMTEGNYKNVLLIFYSWNYNQTILLWIENSLWLKDTLWLMITITWVSNILMAITVVISNIKSKKCF